MLTFATSLLILFYLLVPGGLFRFVFSFFVPLRNIPRTKTEEVTFAVFFSLAPFVLALLLVWTTPWFENHPFPFVDCPELRSSDYRAVFSSLLTPPITSERQQEVVDIFLRVGRRQGRFLTWYYSLLVLQTLLMGWLSKNYGRFKNNRYLWLL